MTLPDISCLVEESLGIQWYFTLSEQQIMEYSRRDKGSWSEPKQVATRPVKLFSATIDRNDKLCLVAYNTSKQLMYYEWDGQQWYQRQLYQISSRFENITRLELLNGSNCLHLFYYIENALKIAHESLIHSYLDDTGWHSNVLMNFLTDQSVTPQLIQNDAKGNLFCVYTRIIRNQTRCSFIYFENAKAAWSKPSTLFQKPGICRDFAGLADSSGHLHMVWVEEAGSVYQLNYKKIEPAAVTGALPGTVCIFDGTVPIYSPSLYIGKELHCFWVQEKKGMVSRSDSIGRTWEKPLLLFEGSLTAYRRVSVSLDGMTRIRTEIGDGYPEFGWTLQILLSEDKSGLDKKEIQKQGADLQMEKPLQASSLPIKELNARMDAIHKEIDTLNRQLDELHTAIYQLQDYIRQKDRSAFHVEAQIRKLSFELEQIRSMRAGAVRAGTEQHSLKENNDKAKQDASIEQESEETGKPLKNVDTGSGEILLGNVSILINPDEHPEED